MTGTDRILPYYLIFIYCLSAEEWYLCVHNFLTHTLMKFIVHSFFLALFLFRTQAVIAQVLTLPAITGTTTVCAGATTQLTDATTGGTWTSGNTSVATVERARGLVRGISAGTAIITYDVSGDFVIDTVTVLASPALHTVTGGGSYCTGRGGGVRIGLNGSDTGVKYQLYDGITATGGAITGTDTALNFGLHTVAGTYRITATDTVTGCATRMTGSAVITVATATLPAVSISTGVGDTVCAGTMTAFTATPVNGGTTPRYQWLVNLAPAGTNSPVYSYVPGNNDNVSVVMISSSTCTILPIAIDSVILTVDSVAIPSVAIIASHVSKLIADQSDTFKAVVTGGGPGLTYNWFKNGIPVTITGSTYVLKNPVNKDSISCVVKGSGPCDMPTFNSVILQVSPAGVVNAQPAADVAVFPNPSSGRFSVKGNVGSIADEEVWLTITNMIGQVVYNSKVTALNGDINETVQLVHPTSGSYLLNVRSGIANRVFHLLIEE
jgi:type IX secretion system substrate protein/Big-like domain-containing protein